jgi:hypothetical protein
MLYLNVRRWALDFEHQMLSNFRLALPAGRRRPRGYALAFADLVSIASNTITTSIIKSINTARGVATTNPRPGKRIESIPLNQMIRNAITKTELRMAANVRSTDVRFMVLSSVEQDIFEEVSYSFARPRRAY